MTVVTSGIPALAMDEAALISVLEGSLYPGASRASIALVINYCRASGLDPMHKPVHIVPMWDNKAGRMRDVIMPGIGLYRIQAARSGAFAGVSEPEFGPDTTEEIGGISITYPAWCRATVTRKLDNGTLAEFVAREFWKENYAAQGGKDKSIAPNAMWRKRPYGQLAKCTQAQALRIAFPEIGAAPTADEMEGKPLNDYDGATIDGKTGEVIVKSALPPYSSADFENNLQKWREIIDSGRKTADEIIAVVSTKGVLTEEQKTAIRNANSGSAPLSSCDAQFTEAEIQSIREREMEEAAK